MALKDLLSFGRRTPATPSPPPPPTETQLQEARRLLALIPVLGERSYIHRVGEPKQIRLALREQILPPAPTAKHDLTAWQSALARALYLTSSDSSHFYRDNANGAPAGGLGIDFSGVPKVTAEGIARLNNLIIEADDASTALGSIKTFLTDEYITRLNNLRDTKTNSWGLALGTDQKTGQRIVPCFRLNVSSRSSAEENVYFADLLARALNDAGITTDSAEKNGRVIVSVPCVKEDGTPNFSSITDQSITTAQSIAKSLFFLNQLHDARTLKQSDGIDGWQHDLRGMFVLSANQATARIYGDALVQAGVKVAVTKQSGATDSVSLIIMPEEVSKLTSEKIASVNESIHMSLLDRLQVPGIEVGALGGWWKGNGGYNATSNTPEAAKAKLAEINVSAAFDKTGIFVTQEEAKRSLRLPSANPAALTF